MGAGNLERGGEREALPNGRSMDQGASLGRGGGEVDRKGLGESSRPRRAVTRPQPTLAGYTRRSGSGSGRASACACYDSSRQMPIGVCSSLWPSGLSSNERSRRRLRSFGSVVATHHAGLMSLMSQMAMS